MLILLFDKLTANILFTYQRYNIRIYKIYHITNSTAKIYNFYKNAIGITINIELYTIKILKSL